MKIIAVTVLFFGIPICCETFIFPRFGTDFGDQVQYIRNYYKFEEKKKVNDSIPSQHSKLISFSDSSSSTNT